MTIHQLEAQIKRLNKIRSTRDTPAVKKTLSDLTKACQSGKGNLLALAIEAARCRATLGEISDACEAVFGRYQAKTRSITGVYSMEIDNDESFKGAQK